MPDIDVNDEFVREVFTYLNELRESGIVNMYGAGSFLQESFGFDRPTAHAMLQAWMDNFGKDSE